jgi:hypothetical protein
VTAILIVMPEIGFKNKIILEIYYTMSALRDSHKRLQIEYNTPIRDANSKKEFFTRMSYNILSMIVRSSLRFQLKFV